MLELLVAVAIIAIVAGLIVTVVGRAREKGHQAACASNLKQLAQATLMYAEDWESYLPPYWNRWHHPPPVPVNAGPPRPDLLHAALAPYLKSAGVGFCPTDPYSGQDVEVWGVTHLYFTYGFNFRPWPMLTTAGDQTPTETRDPERLRLRTPAGYSLIYDPNGKPESEEDRCPAPGANHFGGVNIVYLDGHLKWENRCRY